MSPFSQYFRSCAASALFTAALLLAGGAGAQQMSPDDVIATVNGEKITRGELAVAAAEFGDQLNQVPADRREAALLDLVINIHLASVAAKAAGIDKDPLVATRVQLVGNRTLYGEFLRRKFAENVTEEAARKAFDAELAKFVAGDEVHARHILVPTEEEAKAIIAELDKGGNFVEIAKAKSQDPGSGKNGGDLGFFAKGQMVKPFEDAAFALEVGKYTTIPVKSDFGWHVILVEEKRKQTPPTFESQAQRIQQQMMQATFNKEMEALRANAKIEVAPPPGAPAAAPAPAPAEPAPATEPAQ